VPHYFKAYGLEVYPPDDHSRLLVNTRGVLDVCDRSVGGPPVVDPIRATKTLTQAALQLVASAHQDAAQRRGQLVSLSHGYTRAA
jgi:hypothetical protein